MFSVHFNLHKHYITFLCLPFFHFKDNACNTPGKNVFNLVLFSSLKEFISSIRYFLKFLKLTVFQYVTYHANKIRWINIHHITLQTLLKIKLSVNPITFSLKIKQFFNELVFGPSFTNVYYVLYTIPVCGFCSSLSTW